MTQKTVVKIPRLQIRRGNNPRKKLNKIEELAASIKAKGLMQPPVVRGPIKPLDSTEEHYVLLAGDRRLAALALLKQDEIDCVVIAPGDAALASEQLSIALTENLQREDMNAFDTAMGIVELRGYMDQDAGEEGATTIAMLAGELKKSVSFVTQHLDFLKMPKEVVEAVKEEQISFNTALWLNRLADKADQLKYLADILADKMSVKELKSEIKRLETVETFEVKEDAATEETEAEEAAINNAASNAAAAVNNPRDPEVRTLDTVQAVASGGTADAPATTSGTSTAGHVKEATRPAKKPKPAGKSSTTLIESLKAAKFNMLTEAKLRESMLDYATRLEKETDENKKTELGFILAGLSIAAGLPRS